MTPSRNGAGAALLPERWKDFLAVAAHDLKCYLSSIEGYAEMCLPDPPGQIQKEICAQQILAASKKMEFLLEDLILLSVAGKNPNGTREETFAIEGLAQESAAALKGLFLKKGVALELDIPSRNTLTVGNRLKLDRVLVNLLSNALKFTSPGGRVTLWVRTGEKEAWVGVKDTGVGIEECQRLKVFDKFYQVEPSNHGSLGLGLYIAQEIVRASGGEIYVHSEGLGKGSLFWFLLPVHSPGFGA